MKPILRSLLLFLATTVCLQARVPMDFEFGLVLRKEKVTDVWIEVKEAQGKEIRRYNVKEGDFVCGLQVGKVTIERNQATNPKTGIVEEFTTYKLPLMYRQNKTGVTLDAGKVSKLSVTNPSDTTATPSLPLYLITPGAMIYLQDPYGYVLANDGTKENPKPRYILGIQKTGKVLDTHDWKEFSAALGKIPKGSTLMQYNSCSVSRAYGLTTAQFDQVERGIRKAGLKFGPYPRITCYCEIGAR